MSTAGSEAGVAVNAWPWSQTPLFQGLTPEDLTAVAARLAPRPFSAGEILIRQGVWAGALFIIRSGIVQINLELDERGVATLAGEPPARVVPLRRFVSGDPFGEMSLITGAPPSATARALTDGEVLVLEQQDFLQLAMAHPRLSYNINRILSERLLHTSRQQMAEVPAQVIAVVAEDRTLWAALARQVARLTRRATLCLDLTAGEAAAVAAAPGHDLGDLLGGRLRPVAGEPTAVRGTGDDLAAGDLPALLGRVGADYHYTVVIIPPGHPLLTAALLAYATRTIVAGAIGALPRLRATLAALPAPLDAATAPDRNLVLTDAPAGMHLTAAVRGVLDQEFGVPVRGLIPADRARQPAALAAVARWLAGQRIGWVLGAGGAKGFAHLGALRALRRARIPVDCVAGTSIGALASAGVAMGVPTARIEAAFAAGPAHVFRPTVPLYSILSNRALAAWMQREEIFGQLRIEDLPHPFAISAADLTEGREIVVRHGPLWQAVLASAAIPGIYPPVLIGQHWLVDGGVVNPVPVSIAQLLGADIVVAVDLSEPLAPRQELVSQGPPPPRLPTLPDTILRSRDIMMSEIRAHTAGEPAILIKPQVRGVSMRQFNEGVRFVEAGEAAAEEVLPRLRELLPWLNDPTDAEPIYP